MFKIKNLYVSIDNKKILKDFNIDIKPGELHVIMGPNGSGKSTLTNTIAGNENYEVISGDILYNEKSILPLDPEERVGEGVFVSFQYPTSLPGVNNIYFLKEAVNSIRKYNGQDEISSVEFMKKIKSKISDVDFDESFINRSVNDGFSGGEKKRNEILQLLMMEPNIAILDETDSGLDIDALKTVAQGINSYRNPKRSIILITHYQRILDYLEPDKIHILIDGTIVKQGGVELVDILEEKGYKWIKKEQA
ncbi:MAG: Fe-S cluster assembly ATPase SufC [Candidatus Pelagibacter sp. TMED273]|nr:MAG: Fe-S cluster assembly ATPase SufC [Candidatus Pelagibacter sp. TMED273]|tara:strand:- start:8699 stop:9448 length:750 start_codon:yes stop_codon:yes gene_type:complete